MLFRVTHIDHAGKRRCAHVTALDADDADAQVVAAWGLPRLCALRRVVVRPVLRPVPAVPVATEEGTPCACSY